MADFEARQEFHLKDHLGNLRIVYSDLNENGRIDMTENPETNEILDEKNYYAFGMEMKGDWIKEPNFDQRYLYNGKEQMEGTGLYSYGFRYYDPSIGRFTGVDPIVDQFAHVSGFNYAENSPIANIDLHGLQALFFPTCR